MTIETLTSSNELDRAEVLKALRAGICRVNFKKSAGERRVMFCTLNQKSIDNDDYIAKNVKQDRKTRNLVVYDLEAGDWRTFNLDAIYKNGFKADVELPKNSN